MKTRGLAFGAPAESKKNGFKNVVSFILEVRTSELTAHFSFQVALSTLEVSIHRAYRPLADRKGTPIFRNLPRATQVHGTGPTPCYLNNTSRHYPAALATIRHRFSWGNKKLLLLWSTSCFTLLRLQAEQNRSIPRTYFKFFLD